MANTQGEKKYESEIVPEIVPEIDLDRPEKETQKKPVPEIPDIQTPNPEMPARESDNPEPEIGSSALAWFEKIGVYRPNR